LANRPNYSRLILNFIHSQGVKRFLSLNSREQNTLIYDRFTPDRDSKMMDLIRKVKKKYLDDLYSGLNSEENQKNVTKTPSQIPKNPTPNPHTMTIFTPTNEDEDQSQEVNEELVEKVILSSVHMAQVNGDARTMLSAGSLAFQFLKEKKQLQTGQAGITEMDPEDVKDLLMGVEG